MTQSDQEQLEDAYTIPQWADKHSSYEQARSGGRWIKCPTSFDSMGYASLLTVKDGVRAFGTYVILAELAARCDPPGTLVKDGRPLAPSDISVMTRLPLAPLKRDLDTLSREPHAWLKRQTLEAITHAFRTAYGGDTDGSRDISEPRVYAHGAAAASKQASGGCGGAAPEPVAALLRRCGVRGRHVDEVSAQLEHDATAAARLWIEASGRPNVRKVPGLMRTIARDDGADALPALDLAGLVRAAHAGVVTQIRVGEREHGLTPAVGQNSVGVFADASGDTLLVKAEDIESVEVLA